jgi:hypothetical protein
MTMPDDFKFDSRIRQRMLRRGDLTPAELTAHVEGLPDLQEEHEVMNEFTQPALSPARADALDPSPAFDPLRRVGLGSAYVGAKVPSPSLAAKAAPRPVTPIAQSPAVVRPIAAPPPAAAPASEPDNAFVRRLSPRIESTLGEAGSSAAKAWGIDVPSESESTPGSTLRSDPTAASPEPVAARAEGVVPRPEPVVAKPSSDDDDEDEDEDDDDDLDEDDDDLEGDDDIEGEGDEDEDDDDDDDEDSDDDDDEEPPTNPRGAQ